MVQVIKGKISRKNYLKGKRIYFKLAESWHYQGFELSGVNCILKEETFEKRITGITYV